MTSPTREHLLGYLLGALSPEEHQQVEAEINQDPSLRSQLQRLQSSLEQVGLTDVPPPLGSAGRIGRANL